MDRFKMYSRLQTNNIRYKLSLISSVVAHLTSPVHESDALGPLVHCEFNFSCKIVEMLDETGHDFPHSWGSLWSHSIDDRVRELGVEPMWRAT